jgi:hypothetical protein
LRRHSGRHETAGNRQRTSDTVSRGPWDRFLLTWASSTTAAQRDQSCDSDDVIRFHSPSQMSEARTANLGPQPGRVIGEPRGKVD